jgi:hypothetical protein
MDINKELAELLGLCWHEPNNPVKYDEIWLCKYCGVNILNIPSMQNSDTQFTYINPDFTTSDGKIDLLRLMDDGKGRMPRFLKWIVDNDDSFAPSWLVIADYMMDKNGLLAQAARDYLRREKV